MSVVKEKPADASTLTDEQFALPSRRLRIDDREHILMAANAINSVKGITDEQRVQGRIAIAIAADRLGLDVKAAKKTHLHFESMAIEMPEVIDHPNKHPFAGVLTRLDIASDFPVGGTTSKKVIIPTAVAEKALASLLGMAVDFKKDFDGHDRKQKIGIITEATIGEVDPVFGAPLNIAGFFYAADFPQEVSFIQTKRDELGFSYEAEAFVESMNSDPWICSSCDFTGAAVLYKDKAAFVSTSIHASKNQGASIMTPEEIAAMQAKNKQLETDLAAAKEAEKVATEAAAKAAVQAASLQNLIKPHADALRTCASNMMAAGVGAAADNGHAAVLNKMADQMEAQAVLGKIPSSFDSYFDGSAKQTPEAIAAAAKVTAGEIDSLKQQVKDRDTKIAELTAANNKAGERKSISAGSLASLKKLGIDEDHQTGLTVATLDAACQKAGMKNQDSIALKLNLRAAGMLV